MRSTAIYPVLCSSSFRDPASWFIPSLGPGSTNRLGRTNAARRRQFPHRTSRTSYSASYTCKGNLPGDAVATFEAKDLLHLLFTPLRHSRA